MGVKVRVGREVEGRAAPVVRVRVRIRIRVRVRVRVRVRGLHEAWLGLRLELGLM